MRKESVVCTLFEGHYHYGVAALVNSLYQQGFRGDIYAGYRGELPFWVNLLENDVAIDWKGSKSFAVATGLKLHFLPLETGHHFANYKPDFMLLLWNSVAKAAEQMFYFDPDIVLFSKWILFEEWVTYGVALCEDVNSPLPERHPRRMVWRKHFNKTGINLSFKSTIYANSGFVGINKQMLNFLFIWSQVLENIGTQVMGLNRSSLPGGSQLLKDSVGAFNAFDIPDQDALNVAIEAWNGELSFIGKEGMSFKYGSNLMRHAIGQPKPWNKNFILYALHGTPASSSEKAFLLNTQYPISIYSKTRIRILRLSIIFSAFISRFYRHTN
ncbi:hypothetical protein [Spirosoma areae]